MKKLHNLQIISKLGSEMMSLVKSDKNGFNSIYMMADREGSADCGRTQLFVVRRQKIRCLLGIYAATSKIAMVMAMFTQAFRYAYEPFVFGKDREGDNRKMYAAAMKYFLIFSLLAFLAVMFYLDLLRYLVARGYWEGLGVVAIVMLAEICKGIYFNLSFWYKLTDKTYWGAYFSVIGCVIIVVLNILFVPVYGYLASAWASVAGYAVILLLSYWIGQKEYPIHYDLKSLGLYVLLAAVLYVIMEYKTGIKYRQTGGAIRIFHVTG
jgi:O-antigen/teichoic acid export membrane protein